MYVPWPPLYLSGNLRGNFFLSSSPNQNIINMLVVHIQYVHWIKSIIMQRSIDRSIAVVWIEAVSHRVTQRNLWPCHGLYTFQVLTFPHSEEVCLWNVALCWCFWAETPVTHPGREAYTAYLGPHWYSENVKAMFSVEHMCTMTILVAGWSIDPLRCVALVCRRRSFRWCCLCRFFTWQLR